MDDENDQRKYDDEPRELPSSTTKKRRVSLDIGPPHKYESGKRPCTNAPSASPPVLLNTQLVPVTSRGTLQGNGKSRVFRKLKLLSKLC